MKNKNYPLYDVKKIKDLNELLQFRCDSCGNNIAFRFGNKSVQEKTFIDFKNDVDRLRLYLHNKYHRKHIAIIGENSYEWLVLFFAIANSDNVAVPIDKELPDNNINNYIEYADCEVVFVSDLYSSIAKNNNNVDRYLFSDIYSLIETGNELENKGESINKINVDKVAMIFFTSGTTGTGKAVMLSHKNMAVDINNVCRNFKMEGKACLILPFHHTLGIVSVMFVINHGQSSYIIKSLKRLPSDLKKEKPGTICVVPLFVETFYKRIMDTVKKQGKDKSLKALMTFSDFLLHIGIDLREKFFHTIRESFGGELKYIVCGGAPLDKKYDKIFRSWGITIIKGYGVTECSPNISMDRNNYYKDGGVGLVLPECKVRIEDDGEIVFKGDNVMLGYYKDDAATEEVIKDSWYYTGDIGFIDKKGFLYITGRKKNLIILSNGENISPEEMEKLFIGNDAVEEILIYEDSNKIVAEIYPGEQYKGNIEFFNKLLKKINNAQPLYRQIHEVRLRDNEFPKNSSKKIIRRK